MATKPHISDDNIAAVVALYRGGKTMKEITAITGVGQRTVYRWVKRYKDGGETSNPVHKPRSGRGRKVSQRTLSIIKREVERDPHLTAKALREKNPTVLGDVSVRTVQRSLHDDLGYRSCKPRPKPLITTHQKENRVKFCRKYINWNICK